MNERPYSDDEVEAIFRRALERQSGEVDGFSYDELVEAGEEVGLGKDAIERAFREIEEDREKEQVHLAAKERQRDKWMRGLASYVIIMGAFVALHLLGHVGGWIVWPAILWGAMVALRTFNVLKGPTEKQIKKEQKRMNRQKRRAEQARARRAAARERTARKQVRSRRNREFEEAIEEGVSRLLGVAAKKIQEAAEKAEDEGRHRSGRDEFADYVRHQRNQARVRVETTPPPEGEEESVSAESEARRNRR